ncbi:MAG: hypothetical protein IRZ11_03905 [Clostridia bacterium]|nr:hypothetical protein [Clostridia bacterium]
MRSRRLLAVALALAAVLAAGGAAWALVRAAKAPFVLLTVVATSVGAPVPGSAGGGAAELAARPPSLPPVARVGRIVVAVREEAFLRAVAARLVAPIRLPATVPVEAGELAIERLAADGSVTLAAAGRELQLAPGAARSVLFAGQQTPVWSDEPGDAWRRALLAALAESSPVHVWRIENRGPKPRAALADLPALAAGDRAGSAGAEEGR